jgi:hypothetical protein
MKPNNKFSKGDTVQFVGAIKQVFAANAPRYMVIKVNINHTEQFPEIPATYSVQEVGTAGPAVEHVREDYLRSAW